MGQTGLQSSRQIPAAARTGGFRSGAQFRQALCKVSHANSGEKEPETLLELGDMLLIIRQRCRDWQHPLGKQLAGRRAGICWLHVANGFRTLVTFAGEKLQPHSSPPTAMDAQSNPLPSPVQERAGGVCHVCLGVPGPKHLKSAQHCSEAEMCPLPQEGSDH